MGLDIHLYRYKRPSKEDIENNQYFVIYNIKDYKFIKNLKNYIISKDNACEEEMPIIGYEELGYYCRGLNNIFYADYPKICTREIKSKNTLAKFIDKYCLDEYKETFKMIFLDKFINGECSFDFNL